MASKKSQDFDSLNLLDEFPVAIFEFQFHIKEQITQFNYYNKSAEIILQKLLPKEKAKTGFDLNSILAIPELQRRSIPDLIEILKKEPITFRDRQYLMKTVDGKKIILNSDIKFVLRGDFVVARGMVKEITKIVNDNVTSISDIDIIKDEIDNFKEFFEAFNALIMIVDEEGRILFVSPNISDEMLYKPRKEILNKNFHEIYPKGQADFFLSNCTEALDKGINVVYEYHLPIQNKVRWYQSMLIPIEAVEGELRKVISITKDITEWKIKPIDE
ncbi:MAG: PAS domain S-box protein [Asgard group archaeon]|nr:PAS domain S-box protein [Asgard group archaeon]